MFDTLMHHRHGHWSTPCWTHVTCYHHRRHHNCYQDRRHHCRNCQSHLLWNSSHLQSFIPAIDNLIACCARVCFSQMRMKSFIEHLMRWTCSILWASLWTPNHFYFFSLKSKTVPPHSISLSKHTQNVQELSRSFALTWAVICSFEIQSCDQKSKSSQLTSIAYHYQLW